MSPSAPPKQHQDSKEKEKKLLVDDNGRPLQIYIAKEALSDQENFDLLSLLSLHGAQFAHLPSASLILSSPSRPPPSGTKPHQTVLAKEWLAACVSEGRVLGEGEGWGGMRIAKGEREGLRERVERQRDSREELRERDGERERSGTRGTSASGGGESGTAVDGPAGQLATPPEGEKQLAFAPPSPSHSHSRSRSPSPARRTHQEAAYPLRPPAAATYRRDDGQWYGPVPSYGGYYAAAPHPYDAYAGWGREGRYWGRGGEREREEGWAAYGYGYPMGREEERRAGREVEFDYHGQAPSHPHHPHPPVPAPAAAGEQNISLAGAIRARTLLPPYPSLPPMPHPHPHAPYARSPTSAYPSPSRSYPRYGDEAGYVGRGYYDDGPGGREWEYAGYEGARGYVREREREWRREEWAPPRVKLEEGDEGSSVSPLTPPGPPHHHHPHQHHHPPRPVAPPSLSPRTPPPTSTSAGAEIKWQHWHPSQPSAGKKQNYKGGYPLAGKAEKMVRPVYVLEDGRVWSVEGKEEPPVPAERTAGVRQNQYSEAEDWYIVNYCNWLVKRTPRIGMLEIFHRVHDRLPHHTQQALYLRVNKSKHYFRALGLCEKAIARRHQKPRQQGDWMNTSAGDVEMADAD